jgi:hypothetical protein
MRDLSLPRSIRLLLLALLIATITVGAAQPAYARTLLIPAEEPNPHRAADRWMDLNPVARFRNQADWLVDMGLLSLKDAYGPFKTKFYKKGDVETFNALDFLSRSPIPRRMPANLLYVGKYAYWWFEEGAEVDPEALEIAATRFDDEIYPLNERIFGKEWTPGIDGDERIFLMHQKKLGSYAAGVFSLRDECPRQVCPSSNQREIIYIGLDFSPVNSTQHISVVSHELQHLMQFNNDGNEQRWLDEGLAQLAEHLNGFNPREIGGNGSRAYFNNPNVQLNSWPADPAEDPTSYYGASYLFTTYLYQRFGTPFIQQLARSPHKGLASVEQVLTSQNIGITVDQVFHEWAISNYINTPYAGDGRYYYQSLKLPTRPTAKVMQEGASQRVNLKTYAAQYFLLPDAGEYTLTFRGERAVKFMPSPPPSGDLAWWAFNEPRGAARLERNVDLRKVSEAQLEFRTWFDIQEDYDLAHVMASGDGGKTWNILRGTQTRSCGRRLPCYEGGSAEWLDEQIDLQNYIGKQIKLRFEYLTQAGDTGLGWFVDDIRISGVDFSDDVETVTDGWTAQGFLRVGETIPQGWQVTVIDRGDPMTVTPLTVTNGSGSLKVKVGESGALIVVTGTAPFVQDSATFTLSARIS